MGNADGLCRATAAEANDRDTRTVIRHVGNADGLCRATAAEANDRDTRTVIRHVGNADGLCRATAAEANDRAMCLCVAKCDDGFRCKKTKYCIAEELQCNRLPNCGFDDTSDETDNCT